MAPMYVYVYMELFASHKIYPVHNVCCLGLFAPEIIDLSIINKLLRHRGLVKYEIQSMIKFYIVSVGALHCYYYNQYFLTQKEKDMNCMMHSFCVQYVL